MVYPSNWTLVCLLIIWAFASSGLASYDWQSAEMVDEIKHTNDAMWIHDGHKNNNHIINNEHSPSLIESSQTISMVQQATVDAAMLEKIKMDIRNELKNELRAEVEANTKRALAERELIDSVARRVANWSPSFRFDASKAAFLEEDPTITKTAIATVDSTSATTAVAPVDSTSTTNSIAPAVDDKCLHVKCMNNGICQEGKCVCSSDFLGEHCEIKRLCYPENCLNGGQCIDNTCKCAWGWSGAKCEVKEVNPCRLVNCVNGGECQVETGACMCFGNFKGRFCEIPPAPGLECANVQCQNGGTCKPPGFCNCLPGFIGKSCEKDLCTGVTCLNGGMCQIGKCTCINNFSGPRCEIDPCTSVKCLNGGVCQFGQCSCTPHWEGATCQISMEIPAPLNAPVPMIPAWDSCACEGTNSVNCNILSNRTCSDGPRKGLPANVTHIPETISLVGVSQLYPCHTIPCRNGGKCVKGKCRCKKGYKGLLCEIDKCSTVHCQNNGVCNLGKCNCQAGFKGKFCETDLCSNVMCRNGGTCFLGKCQCTSDFTGKSCQKLSKIGRMRRSLNKRLDRLTPRVYGVNGTVPMLERVTDPEYFNSNARIGAEYALHRADMETIASKDRGLSERGVKIQYDRDGNMVNHLALSPEEIHERVNQIQIPTADLVTDHVSLSRSRNLNVNATELHKALPKEMEKMSKMAFVTEVEESNETDDTIDQDQDQEE